MAAVSHEALFERFRKTMVDVVGPNSAIESKSMFGGIFAWIDGAPGTGKMVGGISSKGRVQLRSTKDVKDKLKALSVKYRVGKQPCVLIKPNEFFGDSAKDLMKVGIESARSAVSRGKRKAPSTSEPAAQKPTENGADANKKAKMEEETQEAKGGEDDKDVPQEEKEETKEEEKEKPADAENKPDANGEKKE